jgi:hypothetical protein
MTTTKFSKEAERIFKSYGAIPHNKLENRFIIETQNGTLILRAEANRIINAIYSMLQNCEDLKDMKSNTGYEFNIHSGKCNFYDDDREFLLNTINEYIFDICSYNATEKRQMELADIYNSNVAKSTFLTNK